MAKSKNKEPIVLVNSLYKKNILFFKGFSFDQFREYLNANMGIEANPSSCDGRSMEIENSNGDIMYAVWVKEMSPSLLAHEACHISHYILDSIGSKMSYENDEHFCYLVEWLMRGFYGDL